MPSGTLNPAEPCQSCLPLTSQVAWSAVEDQTSCGPGKVCVSGVCCNQKAHCEGKVCGTDGCGGSCGQCDATSYCFLGTCLDVSCDDGNTAPWDGCTNGLISEFQVNQQTAYDQEHPEVKCLQDGRCASSC